LLSSCSPTYAFSQKATCLKDYAEIMKDTNGQYAEAKQFFLDVAYDAWRVFNDLRQDNRFKVFREKRQKNTKKRSPVKKDKQGNVVDVSLGVVFPVLYALGELVRKKDDGHWQFKVPEDFDMEDVIEQANATFSQGPNDPAKMGKDSTCYVSVKSPVKMYKKMHERYNRLVEA
jgi:hypothetical protein